MSGNESKISVVVPCYNGEQFLDKAIESVASQTYKNLEIIIINDGSNDRTENIVKAWQNKDSRVRYVKHKKNKGLAVARNTGIRVSVGGIIALLDADDIWEKKKLEEEIKKIKAGADAVYCNAQLVGEKDKKLGESYWDRMNAYPYRGQNCLREVFKRNITLLGSSVLFKKKIWDELEGFDERLKAVEDYDFLLKMATMHYKIDYVDDCLFFYRIHKTRMSSKSLNMEYWRIVVLMRFLAKNPLFFLKNPILVNKRIIKRIVALLAKRAHLYYEN